MSEPFKQFGERPDKPGATDDKSSGAGPNDGQVGAGSEGPERVQPNGRQPFQDAEIHRYGVETELFSVEAYRARIEGDAVETNTTVDAENRREKTEADVRDRDKRTDAEIQGEDEWRRAEIADSARRTAAKMNGREMYDRTTQIERFFWMVITAIGVIAAIVLAFKTAGHAGLAVRFSPAAGLLISGGGGAQLLSIARKQAAQELRDDQEEDAYRKRREAGESEA